MKCLLLHTPLSESITHQPWASEGGALASLDFEIISKKRLFFQFRGVKNKFHHIWPPLEKNLGKIPYCPPWKKSFRRPCHQLSQTETRSY